MLQRLSEDLEYHELLDKAAKCHSSLEQMCYVAAFSVSSYSTTVHRTGKPFNPLLGETFELDRRRESGYRSLCEQVRSYWQAEGQRTRKGNKTCRGGACNYPTESAALVSFFLYFTRTWTLCELTRTGTFWNVPRRDVFLSHWHVFEAFGDFLVESFHLMEYFPALFFFIRFIFGCFKYFKILLNLKYAIYILNFDT